MVYYTAKSILEHLYKLNYKYSYEKRL
jgi:hypothetical protein